MINIISFVISFVICTALGAHSIQQGYIVSGAVQLSLGIVNLPFIYIWATKR